MGVVSRGHQITARRTACRRRIRHTVRTLASAAVMVGQTEGGDGGSRGTRETLGNGKIERQRGGEE